jgi:hypothetical protein
VPERAQGYTAGRAGGIHHTQTALSTEDLFHLYRFLTGFDNLGQSPMHVCKADRRRKQARGSVRSRNRGLHTPWRVPRPLSSSERFAPEPVVYDLDPHQS